MNCRDMTPAECEAYNVRKVRERADAAYAYIESQLDFSSVPASTAERLRTLLQEGHYLGFVAGYDYGAEVFGRSQG